MNGYKLRLFKDKLDTNLFCVEYRIDGNDTIYNDLRTYYGAPKILYHVYNFNGLISVNNYGENKLGLEYYWITKQQTRTSET